MSLGTFPFGQSIHQVIQEDWSPKNVFILGAYASAVHARWIDDFGNTLIRALAVASEPYIFWRGEDAEKIISKINVPHGAGKLLPASSSNNGPSGKSLDRDYLTPLGLTRSDVWLCDLLPHSCMNRHQAAALRKHYQSFVERSILPPVNWPANFKRLVTHTRCNELVQELKESGAKVLITLGEDALRRFASKMGNAHAKLSSYGKNSEFYGQLHDFNIDGRLMKLLPLVHPRQAARLGGHDPEWFQIHLHWKQSNVSNLVSSVF